MACEASQKGLWEEIGTNAGLIQLRAAWFAPPNAMATPFLQEVLVNQIEQRMFELDTLESRMFLSAAVVGPGILMPDTTAVTYALATGAQPLAVTLAKIAGTYTGSVVVTGVHTRPVKVVLKEAANGTLSGTLTTPQDASIKVKVTGKVKNATTFTITLTGNHSGGSINGTGTGTIKGKTLTIKMNFVQGGSIFPGKLTLKRP